MSEPRRLAQGVLGLLLALAAGTAGAADEPGLKISWADHMLAIRGAEVPGDEVRVWYLEAYCRPGSTDRVWNETVIPHTARLLENAPDGRRVRIEDTLADGVIVRHTITAGRDEVDFRVVATNPTDHASEAHWAQPCVRVDRFTGVPPKPGSEDYLPKCFLLIDGQPQRLPTQPWATRARYTPGQVWCPAGVSRHDVNPRPLSALVPSGGLVGCTSADGSKILATAWEPYQEIFQGVIVCLHSDFRIGGLKPGETKSIRGKIYVVPADLDALLERYHKDFPEQRKQP